MAAPQRIVHKRRATITALPLYYSGYLLKKNTREKDFKKYFGELRGAVLFLYEDNTQDTYTEMLDLEQLTSMQLDSPIKKPTPTVFSLTTHTEEIQLKMDNLDTGEEWRGYILTIVEKEIPSTLQLLPGQMLLLKEALAQEMTRRNIPGPNPPLPPRPSFLFTSPASPSSSALHSKPDQSSSKNLPLGFYNVSRQEAEKMLETNPEFGSIILRPSSRANCYGLTLRQLTTSGPAMKNYRVTETKSGFVIELDSPVKVPSLDEVLKYILKKTEYRLQPFTPSQAYDTRIETPLVPQCTILTSTPATKIIPKAKVSPMIQETKDEPLSSPVKPEESEYLVPEECQPEHKCRVDQLDGELRKVLLLRREWIYSTNSGENNATYE